MLTSLFLPPFSSGGPLLWGHLLAMVLGVVVVGVLRGSAPLTGDTIMSTTFGAFLAGGVFEGAVLLLS